MKTRILLFLILFPLFGLTQEWTISNQLICDDDLRIYDIKTDNSSNIYLAGVFKGNFNGFTSEGLFDIFLAKVTPDFKIDWIQTVGSSSVEFDPRITLNENNVFLLGAFRDSCYFDANKYLKSDGHYDVFLAKYTTNGRLNWTEKIANYPSQQNPTDIDIDNDNNLIITGHYTDSVFIYDEKIISSGKNNFYAKFDTSGVKIWVKNITGTSASSRLANVKVYQNEYYFNGYFRDDMNFDIRTITSNVAGKQDMFLYKTNINGDGVWIRRTYGDDIDVTGSISGDNYGNVYFTGYFQSSELRVDTLESVIGNQSLTNINDFDIFIFKYNKNGNLQWDKQFGLNGRDYGVDLNVSEDILYVSGYYSDSIAFGDNVLKTISTSDRDMFITAMDLDANTYNATSLGGSDGNDIAAGSIVTIDDESVMSGYFQSSTLEVGDSIYTNTNFGVNDGIIAKYKPPLSAIFSVINNITCNSDNDGKLIVTPEFGEKPYTYSWSHNGALADSTATGLGLGTYSVTVTDAVDSTAVVSYDLTEPDIITFNPVITHVTQCSYSEEGAIDVSVAGGNGGYQYQWQSTDGGFGLALQAEDQAGLTVGTYMVTVTDSKGCTGDTTMYILGPDPITFAGSVVTDSSSSGAGEIDLTAQGGTGLYSYNWDYPDGSSATTQTITNLNTGNYTVTVTDGFSCEFDTLFNVKNEDDFYIYITDFKDACQGTINGRAKVSYYSPVGNTNMTYLWDDPVGQTTAEATNLTPNRYYHVTVTDVDASKVRVDSVYIDELAYTFDGSLSGTSTLHCNGDTDGYIDLTIGSEGELPYNYSWSTGSSLQDLTNLGIGNYSVTVTDDNECTFSITNYTIDQPTPVSAVAEIVKSPSCNGDFNGEVTVDRSGGTAPYNYQWDDPGFQDTHNADGLDAGYYNVTVSDVNGCEATSGVNLTEPAAISMSKVIDNEDCNGAGEGAIALTVNGGTTPFSYSWSTTNGSGLVLTDKNQSGLTAGNYYVTATDNNNCTYEDSAEITEPPLLEITNEEKTDITTCYGDNTGSITITATGGTGALTYTLNPGAIETNSTGIFNNLGAGNYSVDVTDQNLCSVTSNLFTITEPTALTLTEDDLNNVTCYGTNTGSILISVSGGTVASDYSYNWSTSDGSGISAGLQDQLALGAGTYALTVTDDNACEITDVFTLTEPEEIVVTKTLYDISCHGGGDGVIVINHTGGVLPFSYYWTTDDGSGLDPVNRNQGGLSAGTYNLEITDAIGCVVNETSVITDPPAIQIDSESSTDASGEDATDGTITVEASGGTGSLTYTLKPVNKSNQTGVFSSVSPGEYTVEVIDENYCGPVVSGTLAISYPNATKVDFIYSDIIKLYPNPTSSKFYVELDYTKGITIEVLSLTGQSIVKEKIHPSGFMKKEIDISDEAKGIYLIRMYNDEISYKTKIILQ